MTSIFNILLHGGAADAAEVLGGDNPPETIDELRAALTNALNRIDRLERRHHRAETAFLDEALNSGDGVYRP
jgi:hypothetical protein